MSNSLFAVAFDCADATALARFWAEVLGRRVAEDSSSEHAVLLAGEGDTSGPPITFNRVPEARWTTFADIEGNEFDLIAR